MTLEACFSCANRHYMDTEALEQRGIASLSRDPILADDFLRDLKKKKKKGILKWEFKALSQMVIDQSTDVARLPENRLKNSSPDILPYDHCRVILNCQPPDTGYINASYIDSYTKRNAYIAAQGPNRHTMTDFWEMVWQEDVHCIVMATNLFEHARQQCEKYWHNQHGRYGDIHVWLETSDIFADFNIRTFRVQKSTSDEERIIKQFQFSSWSSHECPNTGAVLEYRRRIRVYTKDKPGPILVHCGSGAGRTGTFIAIDAVLERLVTEKTIDIFHFVHYLRCCRQKMVKNVQQYEFIHDMVAMYLQCGITVINAKQLPYVVQDLALKLSHSKYTGFEREFKTLQNVVPKLSVGECAGGHRAENRRKTRDIMIQPPERARPYLITHDSNDSTDYINAVYVDGYRHSNAYIVTQWPLKSTVNDVWRLIYDYNIPTLVLLNDMPFSNNYPCFWPTDIGKDVHYGPMMVEMLEESYTTNIVTRLFKIKKRRKYLLHGSQSAEFTDDTAKMNLYQVIGQLTLVSLHNMASTTEDTVRVMRMFQLRRWPNGQRLPPSPSPFIELLTKVEDWQMSQCHGRIPTLVMSKNGVSRCGIYCTISITWEKLKTEGEVDIFRAVRTVKTNRTQLVENVVEYIFCYTFIVLLLEILNATHPHMIPGSDLQAGDAIRHSVAANLTDHSLNHTGEYNNSYLNENVIRSKMPQLDSTADTSCDANSSDCISYQTAVDVDDNITTLEDDADWSTSVERSQSQHTMQETGVSLAERKKPEDKLEAVLVQIDNGLENSSQTDLSKMSSYATCLDHFELLSSSFSTSSPSSPPLSSLSSSSLSS